MLVVLWRRRLAPLLLTPSAALHPQTPCRLSTVVCDLIAAAIADCRWLIAGSWLHAECGRGGGGDCDGAG
jgi:hypothetical protein